MNRFRVRRPALDRQLALLGEAVEDDYDDDRDVAMALVADAQAIGPGEDLSDVDEPS